MEINRLKNTFEVIKASLFFLVLVLGTGVMAEKLSVEDTAFVKGDPDTVLHSERETVERLDRLDLMERLNLKWKLKGSVVDYSIWIDEVDEDGKPVRVQLENKKSYIESCRLPLGSIVKVLNADDEGSYIVELEKAPLGKKMTGCKKGTKFRYNPKYLVREPLSVKKHSTGSTYIIPKDDWALLKKKWNKWAECRTPKEGIVEILGFSEDSKYAVVKYTAGFKPLRNLEWDHCKPGEWKRYLMSVSKLNSMKQEVGYLEKVKRLLLEVIGSQDLGSSPSGDGDVTSKPKAPRAVKDRIRDLRSEPPIGSAVKKQ